MSLNLSIAASSRTASSTVRRHTQTHKGKLFPKSKKEKHVLLQKPYEALKNVVQLFLQLRRSLEKENWAVVVELWLEPGQIR